MNSEEPSGKQSTQSKQVTPADAVRAKLSELRITQDDVADAIEWARRGSPTPTRNRS